MKPVLLTFTDHMGQPTKTYSCCSLKVGLYSKIIPIAEKARAFEGDNYPVEEIGEFLTEVKAVVVEAFGRQFTIDELDNGVEMAELLKVIGALFGSINVNPKNPTGGTATE